MERAMNEYTRNNVVLKSLKNFKCVIMTFFDITYLKL